MTKRVALSLTCDNKTIEGVVKINYLQPALLDLLSLVMLLLPVKEYTFLSCLCCSTNCSGDPMKMSKMGGLQTG